MTALMFFLTAGVVIVGGIADAVAREIVTVRNESNSKQSYFTSESGLEDAIYRVKYGKQLSGTETLSIGSSTATTVITTAADGTKQIDATSTLSSTIRTTEASLQTSSGTSFPFALQGGIGGIDMNDGEITGDIYTTGSIRGCGSCTISGSATAAGISTSNVDQDNSSPSTPTNSINFGNSNSSQDIAQSFSVSQSLSFTDLKIDIQKVGNPSNATIKITTDNSGKPSSTILASGTLSSSLASTTYAWMDIALTANPVLTSGTTYWIVIDANTNSSNYYTAAANSGAYSGTALVGKYGGSWTSTSPSNLDMYFKVSIGTNEEGIAGESQFNRLTVGSAYAYNASYVNSSGALYCQVGTQNNKTCDTSRGDPAVQSDPATDGDISSWKSTAASGGTNEGDYTVGYAGATLGPKKIHGNLSVAGGGTLIVSGTIWVTGNVTINGGSTVSPQGTGQSFAIIADGTVTLSGGASITGNSNGHILIVSTSTADPAITLNGGANDTVIYVPHGGFYLSGGATAKAAAAKHITMDGGSDLIYDPSISNLNITSGSSGTSFGIKTWKETQ